jgi:hypothetical protein
MALAMAVRGWEEKLRSGLVTRGVTKAADDATRAQRFEDIYNLFNTNLLTDMFAKKQRLRTSERLDTIRASWRGRR